MELQRGPKPPEVLTAIQKYMEGIGANPGRSGHKKAVQANKLVAETRELLSILFNLSSPKRVIFTLNATDALNLAIKGLVNPGDHVVTSSMEHNSVTRPLHVLAEKEVEVTKVPCNRDGSIIVTDIESALKENTKVIVIVHASNVTGTIMPVEEIGKIAGRKGIKFLVDAAQTAGTLNIDMAGMNIDLLALPGHKGLMGPPGTGILLIREGIDLTPLREGGTGSFSEIIGQPHMLPERYESGTLNTAGIAGLNAGLKWLFTVGLEKIREHENKLVEKFLAGAGEIEGMTIYGPRDSGRQVPVISFALDGKDAIDVAGFLDKEYNVASRAGLHCAPDAHKTLGTFEEKLVRFSFSFFNSLQDIDIALGALSEISKKTSLPKAEGCGC